MNQQPTLKEALDGFKSRSQLKAPEIKRKQLELALPSLLDVLQQDNYKNQ